MNQQLEIALTCRLKKTCLYKSILYSCSYVAWYLCPHAEWPRTNYL